MKTYRTRKSGFTLVEILIVVIILGILAAIVIPQFTNASEDARKNSLTSQLQTLRSQVELFKLQHRDRFPTADINDVATAWDWDKLTSKTDEDGVLSAGSLGPYMQQRPINPLNSGSFMQSMATDPAVGDAGVATAGFVFSQATGKIFALDKNIEVTAD
jgi:general secretion pathway protein G